MLHIFHCWYIIILPAYSAAVRIPVFTSAETASPEFIELFCTFRLLDVELSPNGARAVGATLNDRLKAALAHVGGRIPGFADGADCAWRARGERAYNGDLDAESPAGSRGRAPGGSQGAPPEAEKLWCF